MRRTALIIPTVAVAGLVLLAGCSSGGDSCLSGSWEPAGMADDSAGLEAMGGSSDITLKFDGDKISMSYIIDMPKTDYSDAAKTEMSGEGKYSVSGDKIKVSDFKTTTKVNGEVQADSTDTEGIEDGDSTYSCKGDKLTVGDQDYVKKK